MILRRGGSKDFVRKCLELINTQGGRKQNQYREIGSLSPLQKKKAGYLRNQGIGPTYNPNCLTKIQANKKAWNLINMKIFKIKASIFKNKIEEDTRRRLSCAEELML